MTVAQRYRSNYDRIALDHVEHWRQYGRNPFQDEHFLRSNEKATVHLINAYAPGGKMLDAGCGMGDLLMCFPDRERHGVDISKPYLDVARERGLDVTRCTIEKMPFPARTFDLVTATDILEHVLDLNAAVRELLRVLKRGGILIARTPNEEELGIDEVPYEFMHLRRFDEPTMHLLFARVFGCEVLHLEADGETLHAVVRK
jgi:ubiquinone/menaquinone biosynthesis C-methylase UbiE